MKIHLIGAAAVLIAGVGAAGAQTLPRDRPDAHAVDVAKVATVEQWSKRRGAKVIWGSDPQPPQKTSAVETAARVDAGKVGTVEQQAKQRGHREMWFKYPQQRKDAVASTPRAATASAKRKSAAHEATATEGTHQP